MNRLSAEDVIKELKLVPLPDEGGYFNQTWMDENGTAIYYLITEASWSSLHILDVNEIWHFYAGDPIRQLQLQPDGSAGVHEIGQDLSAGQRPQLITPAGVWQATRLAGGGKWSLVGTTTTPPYTNVSVRFPDGNEIEKKYYEYIDLIKEF